MHKTLWQYILSDISSKVSTTVLDTWFKPLVVKEQCDPQSLVVCAPNRVVCDFVEQHYKKLIYSLTKKHVPKINTIDFIVAEEGVSAKNKSPENSKSSDSSAFLSFSHSFVFNRNFTFDSFVVGPGNEFAKSAAYAVAKAPGKTKFNPLLIYAGVGLGKTHLLHAIGNYLSANAPDCKTVYTSSEEFYLNFIDAIKNNNTKHFSDSFKTAQLLLIDDVHFLSGKESTQEEFFYIFNALYQNERQIVLTTDVPPVQLMGLQDRLVSRFQWGLCVDIQPPDLETRIAILKKKAEEGNLNIAENILAFIAENVSSNIRELEGIIIRLLAFASITKQDITIDLVKNIISEKNKKKISKISIEEIINTVAEYYKVPVNHIREKNRQKEVAFCRQCAMYMVKLFTNYSLKSIGLHFGGRDHSTVIHAIQTIEKLKSSDSSISSDIEHITSILKNI
jgi:chromosomal replication initiator protein DnaA